MSLREAVDALHDESDSLRLKHQMIEAVCECNFSFVYDTLHNFFDMRMNHSFSIVKDANKVAAILQILEWLLWWWIILSDHKIFKFFMKLMTI